MRASSTLSEESDSLVASMGNVEARNGRFALYDDLVWSKIGAAGGIVQSRTLAPCVTGTLGTSLNLDITMAIVEVGAAYEVARSGSVDWLDPIIGARIRYAVAPGHELFLRGDIGGFGLGSDFSWQAIGSYSFDFGTYNGVTFSGMVGYRALSVDNSQGDGRRR